MPREIQPGDVVHLKSGGRQMTVGRTAPKKDNAFTCYWFEGGELRRAEIEQVALKITKDW